MQMKARKQKLLSMLLCAALTATSIVSEGFQVSASELQPGQQIVVEDGTEPESEMPETQSPKEETEESTLPEETGSTTDNTENGKSEETETGTEVGETVTEETETGETEAEETETGETKAEETVTEETEATENEEQTPQEEGGIADLGNAEETQQETSEPEEELTEEVIPDAAAGDIASGSYGDITWVIDADGKLTVTGTGDFSAAAGDSRAPWHSNCGSIILAEINVTGMTDASYMFSDCMNLESVDLKEFSTEHITDMSHMFSGCSSLISLDMGNFDTSQVTDMSHMFSGCNSLSSLDMGNFDTSQVTDMGYMFLECISLSSLDMGNFDTSRVTDMNAMFFYCSSLISLDLSNFNTSQVTSMSDMFAWCGSLNSLDISSFDTSQATDMTEMFDECISLVTIYTPYGLQQSVPLPKAENEDIWYRSDGTEITELPMNLEYSTMITKNSVPVIDESHIEAAKEKTVYGQGEILNLDDLTVMHYDKEGNVREVTGYTTNADEIDMSAVGTKTLTITYDGLTTELEITVRREYTVTFDLNGHGTPIAPLTGLAAGSRIDAPSDPTAKDWEFQGWYKDTSYKEQWDFETDTVEEDITLYACWYSSVYTQSGRLVIGRIPAVSYTGSALKPKVTVYYQTDNGPKRLSAGTDYTIKYFNNIQADTEQEKELGGAGLTENDNSGGFTKDLAYVVITCKGNYKGTVYQNFHIDAVSIKGSGNNPANGFTLKCSEQLAKSNKPLKPFTSLKYKKAMTAGKDYTVKVTVQKAYDAKKAALEEGSTVDGENAIPVIPAGYYGTFLLTVTGINNYTGTITRTVYVTGKDHLMKNASVAVGKNQKSMEFTGSKITLTPAWYDVSEKKYYAVGEDGIQSERDKKNVFTVRIGQEYLLYGRDFTVSYSGNQAVGTATMTLTGMGDYVGTKKVTFRIKGTAFNDENISVDNFKKSLVYTGNALTQNGTVLTDISSKEPAELVYGEDYTVSYKNNVKKGTATMTFTAKPASGYSGSFKKTFKITPAGLGQTVSGSPADPSSDTVTYVDGNSGDMKFDGEVIYTKAGAKPSGRITLTNRNNKSVLKQGTDYTVSYSGNKRVTNDYSLAVMTVTGKGNYKGSIIIYFPIVKAPLSGNENLTVTASEISYNPKKAEDFQYRPQIKITDQNKALSAKKDFEVAEYRNCSQTAVTAYLEALANGTAMADERPYAIVKARKGSNYTGSMEVDLNIYQAKLSDKNLYVVVSKEKSRITYTGKQVRPEVTVYYGDAKAIQRAKEDGETKEDNLTNPSGEYGLTKLKVKKDGVGDYTLTYGANIAAGKNKGSVTVSGTGMYSGKVKVKFTILGKNVNGTGGA